MLLRSPPDRLFGIGHVSPPRLISPLTSGLCGEDRWIQPVLVRMRPHDLGAAPALTHRWFHNAGAAPSLWPSVCGLWASLFIRQSGRGCCFSLVVFVLPAGARTPAHSPNRLFASEVMAGNRREGVLLTRKSSSEEPQSLNFLPQL